MKRARATSSSLFLMEIIIALAVFAGAGVMCMKVFVSAHTISSEAKVYNAVVSEVSAVAEGIGSVDNFKDADAFIQQRYPHATRRGNAEENVYLAAFNDNDDNITVRKNSKGKVKAAYTIEIKLANRSDMLIADMTSPEADYSLTAKHNLKGL